jgi:hypothetical protein
MNLNSWGPAFWHVMHSVSFSYPKLPSETDKNKYAQFYEYLIDVLPCTKCRKHFAEILQIMPIQLNSRRDLSEWVVDVHNQVNKSTKKPELDYLTIVQKYLPPSYRNSVLDDAESASIMEKPHDILWVIPVIIGAVSILAIVIYFIVTRVRNPK